MPDLDTFKPAPGMGGTTFAMQIADVETTNYMAQKLNSKILSGFIRPIIFGKEKTSSANFGWHFSISRRIFKSLSVSFIVPCFNEEKKCGGCLRRYTTRIPGKVVAKVAGHHQQHHG